jgi:hypothetical protein
MNKPTHIIHCKKRIFAEVNPVNKQIAKIFLFFSVSGATLLNCGATQAASLVNSKVYSIAYVNIISGTPDQQTSSGINPSVQSFAQANNGEAFASATGISLKVKAESDGTGLSYPAVANAFFFNPYKLISNPNNIAVPLTFNFGLIGELNAYSTPGDLGSLGGSDFNYRVTISSDAISETKGSVQLQSQAGVPVFYRSGNLGNNKFGAIIKPALTIGLDSKKLSSQEIAALNISAQLLQISSNDLGINPQNKLEERTSLLEGLIINALQLGIPSLVIPPGIKVKVGFDVTYAFDSDIQLTQTITNNGTLDVYLYGAASANLTASGSSNFSSSFNNFGNALKLTSITVPQTFEDLDIENLQVAFDSGDIIQVTRNGNPEIPSTPVPEPSTYCGSGVALILGWLIRRKYKSVQKSRISNLLHTEA